MGERIVRQVRRCGWMWAVVILASAAPGRQALAAEPDGAVGVRFVVEERALPAAQDAVETLRSLHEERGARHFIATFHEPITSELRAQLAAGGIVVQESLGQGAAVIASPDDLHAGALRRARGALRSVHLLESELKVSPRFGGAGAPGAMVRAVDDAGQTFIAANVLFHRDVVLATAAREAVRAVGGWPAGSLQTMNALVVILPADAVDELATQDAVQWIEPMLPPLEPFNAENRAATQADEAQAPPYELSGAGVRVLVYDVWPALENHVDFGGRLTNRFLTDDHDHPGLGGIHSTHVAGTVAGNGAASGGLHRGMAPQAIVELYHTHFVIECENCCPCPTEFIEQMYGTNLGDLEGTYIDAVTKYDVDLATNSHGLNITHSMPALDYTLLGDYQLYCAVVDGFAAGTLGYSLPIFWAAGNERFGPNDTNPYKLIPPPVPAKNSIAIGATNAEDNSMTHFSSWGPTDDGRLKPDLVAPGCQDVGDLGVTSCDGHGNGQLNQYVSYCGTSMAAPTVAGAAALLIEDYNNRFPSGPRASNALVRTLLAHSALDLHHPGPDYQTGYGLVQIRDAIDVMRDGAFATDVVDHAGVVQFHVDVPAGAAQVRITLAWDDPPATPLVIPSLVNDLDLHVFGAGGARHFPWTLDPEQPELAATQLTEDRINIIEQVLVNDPAPGSWIIEVHGFNVPEGPQSFAIAASPTFAPPRLIGDVNLDGVIDLDDRVLLCSALGSSAGDPGYLEDADFNDDGEINELDLHTFNNLLPVCDGDIVTSATFQPPPDGVTDAADLAYLLGAWAAAPSCADFVTSKTFAPPPDGKVDAADLAFLLGAWGACR